MLVTQLSSRSETGKTKRFTFGRTARQRHRQKYRAARGEVTALRLVESLRSPPGRRLKRFAKIALEPGRERTVNFTLRQEDLSFIGNRNLPVVEPGDFEVAVGGLKSRFTLQ